MLEDLTPTAAAHCERSSCSRPLADEPTIAFRTGETERRAYECACGAVTITVARQDS